MIRILAVGKKHEAWIVDGVERYEKRLQLPFKTEWVLIPHSAREGRDAREDESQRIVAKLAPTDFVILLDERGRELDSPTFSGLLQRQFTSSRKVTLIIGGAYGVDDTIHQRADFILSLSPLVFPHQLVRLIIAEQLYRAQEIAVGHPYHHE